MQKDFKLRMMLANKTKATTNVLFTFNVGMTVTQLADMKKSLRAIKATMYRVALIALILFFIPAT